MAQLTTNKFGWVLPAKATQPPPKRYRIGELAQFTGLTRQTLHNYTRWGLIEEAEWTPGGHRLYDESVFVRLGAILRLRRMHTVEEMKRMLASAETSEPDSADNSDVMGVIDHGQ